MAIALDSSALLKRYLFEPGHELVNEYLKSDPTWCASALARTEVQLALHRVASDLEEQRRLWSTFREDWERIAVVPTDQRCLARAVEIGATFLLGTIDALHLAAADRLPRPLTYLTFDSHQIPAALGLGFEVASAQELEGDV
ncbi:MAG: type II toxin-antitoxin system VapC family toxin [Acidimicrobiales bacterium]|nr:type II toxin-antitoxin system VapC family toxin [Acidimicrobiales bacterium]